MTSEDRPPRVSRVFRREALDRLRTPEPLDRPVTFAPPAIRLGLLGLAWLAAWALARLAGAW